MALSNYTELSTSIAKWLKRNDLTAYIPDFITLAESYMNDDLRLRSMKTEATITLSTTNSYVDLPTGFLEVISLVDNNGNPLQQRPYEGVQVDNTQSGEPDEFAITSNIQFNCIGSSALSYTMLYYKALDITTDATNNVLTNHPNIYLYGALLQATPYIKDDKRLPLWQHAYDVAVKKANSRNIDNIIKLKTDHPSVPTTYNINKG